MTRKRAGESDRWCRKEIERCVHVNEQKKNIRVVYCTTAPKVGRHRIQNEMKLVRSNRAYVCIFVRHILIFLYTHSFRFSLTHITSLLEYFSFLASFSSDSLLRRIRIACVWTSVFGPCVSVNCTQAVCALFLLLVFILASCCCRHSFVHF